MTKTNMDTIQVEPVWSHKMIIVKYSSFFLLHLQNSHGIQLHTVHFLHIFRQYLY